MAPKKRTTAKSELLVEQDDVPQATKKPKRELSRRNTEMTVEKIIKDNFKTHSQYEVDGMLQDGRTLRQRLLDDRRQHNRDPRSLPMGGPYYKMLKLSYTAGDSPMRTLKVVDESAPINEALVNALMAFRGPKRARGPLCDFLTTATSVTQGELVGILKTTLDLNPNGTPDSLYTIVDVMRFVKRLQLERLHGTEIAAMRSHFDMTLLRLFNQMFQDGVNAKTFWSVYGDIAALVVDAIDCKTVLEAKDSWLPLSDVVDRITKASLTGSKMFGFAIPLLRSAKVKEAMGSILTQLAAEQDLTGSVVEEARAQAVALFRDIPGLQSLPALREIVVSYRGVDVKVPVQSVTEELNVRLAAIIKTRARETDVLDAIFMEDALVSRGRPKGRGIVHESLVAESKLARQSANQMLAIETWSQGETVKELLERKLSTLVALDRTFVIEHRFILGMMGEAGEKRLLDELLACLPDAQIELTLRQSSTRIAELSTSDLYKFASRAAQGGVTATATWLQNMVLGFPPAFSSESSHMLLQVRERLPFFVRHTPPAASGSGMAPVREFGKAALESKLAALRERRTNSDDVRLEDMEVFHVFNYLLDADDQSFVQEVTQAIVKQKTGSSSERPAHPLLTNAGKAKAKAHAKAVEARHDTKAGVLSLFKN